MTARARVDHDFTYDGVAIWLGRKRDDGMEVMLPVDPVMQSVPAAAAASPDGPSLRLPEDMARALLDALSAHFAGTSDVQTLRKDYLAERARVDKMIDRLTRTEAA